MTGPDSPGPCPRCAEQIAQLHARLQFRPCGFSGTGAAVCEVRGPDGRVTRGTLCLAHTVLLSAAPAFGVEVLSEEDGPCGWLVPAEESSMAEQAAVPEEVTA